MNAYNYSPSPTAVSNAQLIRWINENNLVVERIMEVSGGDSRIRAAKDFLRAFGGTWQKGIQKWKRDPVAGMDFFNDYIEGLEQ